jgi:hypothetical protein
VFYNQEYHEMMDAQLAGLLADVRESGDNAAELKRLVREFDINMRHAANVVRCTYMLPMWMYELSSAMIAHPVSQQAAQSHGQFDCN